MKRYVRSLLYSIAPSVAHYITATRFRQVCKERYFDFQTETARKLYGDEPITVLSGPFQGMRYLNLIIGGSITPKWLGSYEAELHPILNSLDLSRYTTLINIGSAEGYYAVGLARHRPKLPVYAFDVNPYARRSLKQIAAVNNLRSIVQGGYCTASQLQEFTQQCALVICDIEGYESELLDPAQIGNLRNADILVEIHPHQALSLTDTQTLLISRFAQSHHVTALQATSRPLATWQALCGNRLSPAELAAALDEHRSYPDQSWLWLKAQQ